MARRSSTFEDPLVLKAALEGLELQRRRIDAQIPRFEAISVSNRLTTAQVQFSFRAKAEPKSRSS